MLSSVRYGSPTFMIPGAQKCGTTALAVFLDRHPRLRLAKTKEPDFFSREARYRRGSESYRREFPRRRYPRTELFFEASVEYFTNPAVPGRLATFDPELRFILMVREPGERALSAWNMYRTLCTVPSERVRFEAWLQDHDSEQREAGERLLKGARFPTFAEAVDAEIESIKRGGLTDRIPALVAGGLYAPHFERFLAHFDRDHFLVLEDRELAERPSDTLDQVLAFLGLEPHQWGDDFPTVFAGTYEEPPDEAALARLRKFYAPSNARFFELAGRRFEWGE